VLQETKGGDKFLDDLLTIIDAPYVEGTQEERANGTEPITLAYTVLLNTLQKSPAFMERAIDQNIISRLLQIMHNHRPDTENHSKASSLIIDSGLVQNPAFENAYRAFLSQEDPSLSAEVSLTLWKG
jgi:hypothetical protein